MTSPEPGLDPATAVSVGRIVGVHGIKGEVKVQPLTDFPQRFRRGSRLWLQGEQRRVEQGRAVGRLYYLKLDGIDDRDAAAALRDEELLVPQPATLPDTGDVFYQHDVVGLRVETEAGEHLGAVESIFSTGANDVYVVRGERGELLLPAVEDVVKQIDIAGGRLVIDLLPGLEFSAPAPAARPPRRARARRPRASEKPSS